MGSGRNVATGGMAPKLTVLTGRVGALPAAGAGASDPEAEPTGAGRSMPGTRMGAGLAATPSAADEGAAGGTVDAGESSAGDVLAAVGGDAGRSMPGMRTGGAAGLLGGSALTSRAPAFWVGSGPGVLAISLASSAIRSSDFSCPSAMCCRFAVIDCSAL
jgi:hypothetical protein